MCACELFFGGERRVTYHDGVVPLRNVCGGNGLQTDEHGTMLHLQEQDIRRMLSDNAKLVTAFDELASFKKSIVFLQRRVSAVCDM